MTLQYLNASVVVTAKDHNPTILHPAFLVAEKIVPEEWSLQDSPLCTPMVSTVKYGNGISFLVESNRLSVTDTASTRKPAQSLAPKVCRAYIDRLPHVRYTAVGVNLHAFVECDQPESFLIDRFLKSGPWNEGALSLGTLGLRLAYPVPDATLNLSCDAGAVTLYEEEHRAVLLRGNYHSEVSEDRRSKRCESLIDRWSERCLHFEIVVNSILGLEA